MCFITNGGYFSNHDSTKSICNTRTMNTSLKHWIEVYLKSASLKMNRMRSFVRSLIVIFGPLRPYEPPISMWNFVVKILQSLKCKAWKLKIRSTTIKHWLSRTTSIIVRELWSYHAKKSWPVTTLNMLMNCIDSTCFICNWNNEQVAKVNLSCK